ncbi:MAG: thioredoxin family protein [Dehalococcoidia bacterium]
MAEDSDLIEFYGTECVYCMHMEPLLERLRDEEGVEVKKIEVWHNETNAKLMMEYDKGYCGGVPFFYNKRTGKRICGAVDYEALKKWAAG